MPMIVHVLLQPTIMAVTDYSPVLLLRPGRRPEWLAAVVPMPAAWPKLLLLATDSAGSMLC